jgi:hypothetical protein
MVQPALRNRFFILSARCYRLVIAGAVLIVASRVPAPGPTSAISPTEIRYEVVASKNAADLQIEAELPAGLGSTLAVDPVAGPFIDSLFQYRSGQWIAVTGGQPGWRASGCARSGCRVRYVFHLRAAAEAIDDPDTAAVRGTALVAPASTWLLRPEPLPDGVLRGRVHVTVPDPLAFVTGLPRVAGVASTYAVALLPFFVSPYSAFGRFDVERLSIGGADIQLAVAAPSLTEDRARIRAWTTAAARAIAAYFDRFPVEQALVLAVPQRSGMHGKALGGGGATVLLQIAPGMDLRDPAVDWQAAHEMVHLAVPEMSRAQIWLTEGLATYVEPLARTMTGELRAESVWMDLVRGLPKGLPGPDDQGLDRTHTWGRTYWGGALFALLADLEIRKATNGQRSLATALQGVLQQGGDARVFWSVERFMSACDRAVGKPILTDLYHRMAARPVAVDLDGLWHELGIVVSNDRITFDDHAPLAAIRRRMIGPATVTP